MSFNVNKDFATKYDSYRRKEEIQKHKDRFGSEEDDSTSEEEEEDPNFTKESNDGFMRTLLALKKDDPSIYNTETTFYNTEDKTEENGKKSSKEMTLKDYDRNVILKKGGQINDESEELAMLDNQTKGIREQQDDLKSKFKQLAEESDDSDDEELFTKVKQTEKAKSSTSGTSGSVKKSNVMEVLDDKELFVHNYLAKQGWNEAEGSDVDYSSGEELADRKYHKVNKATVDDQDGDKDEEGDLFTPRELEVMAEVKPKKEVNVREMTFDRDENREPKSYPRGSAIQSVRQQTTKGEKNVEKRLSKKKRKQLKEAQYKEDVARQKNMKMAELAEKMETLKDRG